MRRKTLIIGAIIVLVMAAAFLAGYWPEHRRRTSLETDNDALRTRIVALEDRVRFSTIHAKLLDVIDAVTARNYGQAQGLSSSLFDDVRAEVSRTRAPRYRDALQETLGRRNAITATLANGDASAIEPLRESEGRMRREIQ